MKDDFLPSLLDREIRSVENDEFGHRDLSDALKSLIESPKHRPPYSIGLLGSWGSGKSSIKEIYLSGLDGDLDPDQNGKLRSEKIKPITFNAWRFGGENIKRALIRHVYVGIGGSPTEIMDRLFRRLESSIREPKRLGRVFQDFLHNWLGQALQIVLVSALFLGVVGVVFWLGRHFSIENDLILAGLSAVALGSLAWASKELFSSNRLLLPLFNEGTRIDEPLSSAEQYEQLLLEELEKFKKSPDGKQCQRLVIFLDDLDRLSSEEMVAGLDAVRTFLEIDAGKLPKGLGLIFVISCDEGLVAEALSKRSARNGDIPGTISDASSARRYLDRIFQFRLDVPDIPKQDMRSFVSKRIESDIPDLVDDLKEKDVSLEELANRLVHYDVSSPRNAIQLINAFSQAWWLANRREREGAGSSRAGGLASGAVTEHPLALAALCGLRVNFPEFYQDLLKNSEFITRFSNTFCRTSEVDPDEIPDSVQFQLKRYANNDWVLKDEHRPLRSFISNLQGLRWPEGGLMPLLQLSQDPISREFGPRDRQLYDTIRNADTQGVLEILDLSSTDQQLTPNHVRKISGVWNEIDRIGGRIDQENSLACFAGLANRMPPTEARLLLTPLVRRMRDSDNLRWRVGLERIQQLIPVVEDQDKRDISAILVYDILNASGEVRFQTTDLQAPVLDQAREMVLKARDIVLDVRKHYGLSPDVDTELRESLLRRRISVKGREESREYNILEIEKILADHEDHLSQLLSDGYSDQIISCLEDENTDDFDVDRTLARVFEIFEDLVVKGADSIATLAEQLSRLLKVRDATSVDKAVVFLKRSRSRFETIQFRTILMSLCGRMLKQAKEPEHWEMNWIAGGEYLLTKIEASPEIFDETFGSESSKLILEWSKKQESGKYATRFSKYIFQLETGNDSFKNVLSDFTSRLFAKSLASECQTWIASQYLNFQEDQRQEILKRLNSLVENQGIQKPAGDSYKEFVNALDPVSKNTSEIQAHFGNLLERILGHRSQHEYVKSIAPVVAENLKDFPKAKIGKWLQDLFSQTKGDLSMFSFLHRIMVDVWPLVDEFPNYNPDVLFTEADKVVRNNAAGANDIAGIVRSLAGMVQRSVVSTDKGQVVAELACLVWRSTPGVVLEVLQKSSTLPAEEETVKLSLDRDLAVEENRVCLSQVWRWIFEQSDSEYQAEVCAQLLSQGSEEFDGKPDYRVETWLELSGKEAPEILSDVLEGYELNEEQRKRIWFRILPRVETLNTENLLKFADRFLGDEASLAQRVWEHRSVLEKVFSRSEDRFHLGQTIFRNGLERSDRETMNRLFEWSKEVNGESVLEDLNKDEPMEPEKLDALRKSFPKAKSLKKMKEKEG